MADKPQQISGTLTEGQRLRAGGLSITRAHGVFRIVAPGVVVRFEGDRFVVTAHSPDTLIDLSPIQPPAGPAEASLAAKAPSPPPLLRLGPGGAFRRDVHDDADLQEVTG